MSVLNQSGEEQVECPLCMEPLEVDDLNFFPCTCGYQICRFCWHRIRTDENGLCPACRKAYSENPADFIPLSKEQVAQLKAEKRQRDQQRKAKLSESRKHLARVVQRNLVFVVGLPMRLADPEVLKKYEYFGKFGKIHKVVINQSTAYAGTQGPSASAYVTYLKSDDALRAIQNVNNTIMDGKTIKTSLGTTKYCSHFMKNQPCPKPDCMYLHDFGDQEASFTKEQMHAGKHQEYEKKLHDALLSKLAAQATAVAMGQQPCPAASPTETQQKQPASKQKEQAIQQQSTNKENWPQLNDKVDKKEKEKAEKDKQKSKKAGKGGAVEKQKADKKSPPPPTTDPKIETIKEKLKDEPLCITSLDDKPLKLEDLAPIEASTLSKLTILDDNSSFFSQNSFAKITPDSMEADNDASLLLQHNEPLLEINSDPDTWEFDFGYTKHSNHLEELAKQRINVKDTLDTYSNNYTGLESFSKLETSPFAQMDGGYNTENLLETLAKNSVNYAQSIQTSSNGHYKEINGIGNMNGLDHHMSKFFNDFCRNGFGQPQQPQQPQISPNVHMRDNMNMSQMRDGINGGLSQNINININGLGQQNGYHHHHHHHLNLADKHTLALLQQERQIQEQLSLLSLSNKQQYPAMNGHYDMCQNGQYGPTLASNQMLGTSAISGKSRPIVEDKELDFRFQEAQKALEELVESDSYMHNTGRTNIGSSQINGLVHSQSGNHLPPPPGFVQPTTHMNSFGSKILPYLNMNSQQQQINTTQSSWPNHFSQIQQQQQSQHKGMGVCNDWKVLDPAILTSRRHIPNMPPLIDQYSPLQHGGQPQPQQSQPLQNGGSVPAPPRSFDSYNNGFTNFTPLQQSYSNYSHLTTQQNLNWLGNEINTQISSPPGFRTSGQATKQQEC